MTGIRPEAGRGPRPPRDRPNVVVNSTGKQQTLGSACTPGSLYAYTLDPAANVPALVRQYTGPQASISM